MSRSDLRHFVTSVRNEKVHDFDEVLRKFTIPVLPATLVVKALWSQNPVDLNASTSVASGTVRDETIPVSTPTASAPRRKRSGSTSLEPDAPPKRLKLGPLKGWGVERDGVNISAAEFAQKHWSKERDTVGGNDAMRDKCCLEVFDNRQTVLLSVIQKWYLSIVLSALRMRKID
ncbi:hypothetical protein C8R44DRAFT_731214 [Mycena epipterygia]|nr:hypothetical protein C8R44DRAFT_731214 [Mycena epipterygia]